MIEHTLSAEGPMPLAAELALGLLEGEELVAALDRERAEPGFAREVALWRARTETWIDDLPRGSVDAAVWSRIEDALARDQDHTSVPSSAPVRATKVHSARFWRGLALAASLALVLVTGLSARLLYDRGGAAPRNQPQIASASPPDRFAEANVAQITGRDGTPLLSAVYQADTGTLRLSVADLDTADSAPELWVIDQRGKPHSLGLVERQGPLTVELSDELRRTLTQGASIAITLERREGAPHQAPQGKMIGIAKLSRI